MIRLSFVLIALLTAACTGSSNPSAEAKPVVATAASTASAATVVEATPPPGEKPAADLCALEPTKWKDCDGKMVEVEGSVPKFVSQHPLLAPMGAPGGEQPKIHQSYMDGPEGGQVILLSMEPNTCSGKLRVRGKLRSIDLGGKPGTKESYQGWAMDDAKITCL